MPWDPDTISSSQINDLRQAAEQAWGEDTRYEGYIGHPQPSAGQCYVTSQWMANKLGGHVGVKDGHFFWVSPDKRYVIDLAGDQYAHAPAPPEQEGVPLDEGDEAGWEYEPYQKTWRPGPAMYKRADHPLYRGFRVVNYPDHERANLFGNRANAALRGDHISRHQADRLGPSGLQTPQQAEDYDMQAPMPMLHDEPSYDPVADITSHEYQWVFANGQLHVSPMHSHEDLFAHAGENPVSSAPAAVGYVTVHQGRALWDVESNMSLRGLHKILSDYSDTVGWDFDGMVGSNGQHLHDDFGPKASMWYAERDDGHLVISQSPLPHGHRIQIVGKTAYSKHANEGLEEWATDFGYKLAEFPGGGDMTDKMKVREHLDLYNRGDTDFQPERDNPDQDLGDNLTCGACGQKFDRLEALRLHERDHEPREEEIQDGHFPQLDDFDAPLPFRRRQPGPNWGENIARTVVMPLLNHRVAARHPRFDLYAALFDYAHDDKLRFYGAFRRGQLVGYGAIRLNSGFQISEPEVLMIDAVQHGTGIGSAILSLMQRHYDKFYTHADSKAGERLMSRCGMVNVEGQRWRWAKGQEPKDMIEAAIPFIYDIDGNDQHKDGYIALGYPGQRTSDIAGKFTPGGIVEGYYEPGGKIILISATNMPYTVRHFANLWYHLFPQMEITNVELEGPDGKTQKLAAEEGYMYHVAPREYRESIMQNGLASQGRGFDVSTDDLLNRPYGGAKPVYLSYEAGKSADTRYDTTSKDIWKVNTRGLPLVADLPGLYDNGAYFGQPDEGIWYEEHGPWNALLQPYLGQDREEAIPYEDLLDPDHPVSQAAIQTTQTAAHLGNIPPERLQLMPERTAKLAAQNVGNYIKTLVGSDQAADSAYSALRRNGGKVYVVGGAVRDALQQREPKDLDLMVAGMPPEQVEHVLSSLPGTVNLTGKRFGVFRYKVGGQEVEIALPRQDKYETARRGEGVITVDHNLPVDKDLERRDFTANSMAVDLDSGQLIDPHDGASDLERNVLRTTHPDSFREDPTRLVRALVAHSRYGLSPDERTRYEMEAHGHMLRGESPDALNKVLDKLFTSHNPAAAIRLAKDTGVLQYLYPEVAANWDFDQNNPHHNMVLGEHLLHVMDNVAKTSDDPDLRFAALYHDVGKPASEWRDPETGSSHYYQGPNGIGAHHEYVGTQMAEDRLRALNYPVTRINRVKDLISNHMFPAFNTDKGARRFLGNVGSHADDLLTLRQADMEGKGNGPEYFAARTSVDKMRELVDQARRQQAPTDLQNLAVNGNDLISQLGMQPGPAIGNVLRALMEHVIEVPTDNNPQRLLQLAQSYQEAQPE